MKTEDDADIETADQEAHQEKYESGQEDPDKLQINVDYHGSNQKANNPQNEGDVTEDD